MTHVGKFKDVLGDAYTESPVSTRTLQRRQASSLFPNAANPTTVFNGGGVWGSGTDGSYVSYNLADAATALRAYCDAGNQIPSGSHVAFKAQFEVTYVCIYQGTQGCTSTESDSALSWIYTGGGNHPNGGYSGR